MLIPPTEFPSGFWRRVGDAAQRENSHHNAFNIAFGADAPSARAKVIDTYVFDKQVEIHLQVEVGCFGAGARGPGSLGLAPVVATASFPLINLPNFILASLS